MRKPKLRFWKREPKRVIIPSKTDKFVKDRDYQPPKYPKKVRAYCTIYQPGGGSKVVPAYEVSSELLRLPGKEDVFTGVPPDICPMYFPKPLFLKFARFGDPWKIVRMHHKKFGMPFTFDPRSGRIYDDRKKRKRMLEFGHLALEFGDRTAVVQIDMERWAQDNIKLPLWKDKYKTEAGEAKEGFTTWEDLEAWVRKKEKEKQLEQLEIWDLPVYTEHDVTELEMMRAEAFQLYESKGIEKCIQSMEQLSAGPKLIWYFVTLAVLAAAIPLMFLYFANEGVFSGAGLWLW